MSATATSVRRAGSERARAPRRAASARPPRRTSGPVGGRARAAGAARAVAPRESIALSERALALVRGLPDHSLIDRLVRGQAWIPVLGILLAGIVAMQVEILKLGSSMGRSVERSALLQTQNEALRASVAGLADDQRIERLAAAMGMSMPTPESLVFLRAHPGASVDKALANIHAPDPTGFTSQLAAQAAAAAALLPPAPASTTGGAATTGAPGVGAGVATSTPTTTSTTSTSATTTATSAPAAASPTPSPTSAAAGPGTTSASGTGVAGPASGAGTTTGAATATGAGGAASIAPAGTSQSGGTTGG